MSAALIVGFVCAPAICDAQNVPTAAAALQHFENNIVAYITVRERASTAVPEVTVTSDPARLQHAVNGLAERMRMVRQHARAGEIFTDDVERVFRDRIRQTLNAQGVSPAELLASITQDTSRIPARDIAINAHFDWNSGWEMAPEILEALPALPEALEYRLVHRDLLLVDVGADLVVDVLHDAIQRY
jgi:hypothetical protein